MKCQFCGKSVGQLFAGPNDVGLCGECHDTFVANMKENINQEDVTMGEVIEMKGQEVVEEGTPVENPLRCEVVIGVLKDGRLYFNVTGEGADLLVIDGLLKYAERRLTQQWDIRDMELARAAQQTAQE